MNVDWDHLRDMESMSGRHDRHEVVVPTLRGEMFFEASRSDVAFAWSIYSDAFVTWVINGVEDAWEILGRTEAREVATAGLLEAVETYDRNEMASPETWGTKLARQHLFKALDRASVRAKYMKVEGERLHHSDEAKHRLTSETSYDTLAIKQRVAEPESDRPLLLNRNPEGFKRHDVDHWSVCGLCAGIIAPEFEMDEDGLPIDPPTCYRRPASHEHGYGILCLDCFPKLSIVDNSFGDPTPIHELTMLRGPWTVDPITTANVGTKSAGFEQDGSRVNSAR